MALLALLNSRAVWFYLFGEATPLRGGKWRILMQAIYVERVPIPIISQCGLTKLGDAIIKASHLALSAQQGLLRRIPDLCPPDRKPKLTTRLQEWWKLDFKSFQAEIKKGFKVDIPLKQRNEWEIFLREEAAKVRRLTAEIEQAEREIDAMSTSSSI
jgi:hypothetical protein